MKYDLVLKNGYLVDPENEREGAFDLAVKDGVVCRVDSGIPATQAADVFDLEKRLVMPGLVDLHVHVSEWIGGRMGHKMMALAGVTTALDTSGPVDGVLELARDYGAGLSLACLHYVRPGHTVPSENPDREDLVSLVEECLSRGALGFKILGGHYPLDSGATRLAMEVANERKAYVAFHAGTLAAGSDLEGFREALGIIGDLRCHLAHINSYCRGRIRPVVEEVQEAVSALSSRPHITTEAYLSPINGTSSRCSGGRPESAITRQCLVSGGFEPTEEGLSQAILAGWAQINMEAGGVNQLAIGRQGLEYWRSRGTDGTVSFAVNPGESRYLLATAKGEDGSFVVDAISTDGGGIPRNDTARLGMGLVRFGGLTLPEFVRKASTRPARILGLSGKGHLGEGADGDIAVLDPETGRPHMTVANGRLVMYRGVVVGSGTRMITTVAGREHVREYGLSPLVVDLPESGFYKK